MNKIHSVEQFLNVCHLMFSGTVELRQLTKEGFPSNYSAIQTELC